MRSDPLAALFAELGRLRQMARLESELSARGFARIAGVDEVGRGCLAGPVVAGAVILPAGCVLPGLDDSKRLDPGSRDRLDRQIRLSAVAIGLGVVEARQIDSENILRASLEAMRRAVSALDPEPDVLLVDAVRVPAVRVPQLPVIHGDALSQSIAAASIVAKVFRDRLLEQLGQRHPVYGFESHKGYGTPEHWEALRLYGPCPEHRMTFRGVTPEADSGAFVARQAHRRGQSG